MRVLICGGRTYNNIAKMLIALSDLDEKLYGDDYIEIIIHGGANGADTIAGDIAKKRFIPVKVYPADWKKHGKAAGSIRNQQMLDEGKPDIVLAFPDPKSKGTWDMIRKANNAGIEVRVY
jgi:YspA, cpYpsA-related SLOG family